MVVWIDAEKEFGNAKMNKETPHPRVGKSQREGSQTLTTCHSCFSTPHHKAAHFTHPHRKEEDFSPCPATTHPIRSHHTLNSPSSPMNFCQNCKYVPPLCSPDLPMVPHSLLVLNCNSSAIPK